MKNIKRFNMQFNVQNKWDKLLFEHLENQRNKTDYVKNLILDDIKRQQFDSNKLFENTPIPTIENINIDGLGAF